MESESPVGGVASAEDAQTKRECPSCQAPLLEGDKFCTKCGQGIVVGVDGVLHAQPPPPPIAQIIAEVKLASARKWLLGVAILMLVSGCIFYFIQSSQIEKDIREAQTVTMGMSDAERDDLMKQETGMTWTEAIAHDRGMVNLSLAANIALAVIYFVLWLYAKKNPFAAAVIALLLFITVILIGAVLDPNTLKSGIIVKVFFIVALSRAISAGAAARKAGLALS